MDAKEVLILITGAHKAYALHMVSRIEFKAKKVTNPRSENFRLKILNCRIAQNMNEII